MRWRLVWVLVVLNLGCAAKKEELRPDSAEAPTAEAPPPATAEASPEAGPTPKTPAQNFDLKAMVAREVHALPQHPVHPPDGSFEARVMAARDPTFSRQGEGPLEIHIPIGTDAQVECFAYTGRIDAAASLITVVDELKRSLSVEAFRPVEISAAGGEPAMFVEVDYTAPLPEGGRGFGQMKLAVRPADAVSVLCAHDEAGYRGSFRRVVGSLFGTLQPTAPSQAPAARFDEIQRVTVNDLPIGFAQRRLFTQEGQQVEELWNSMVLQRSQTEVIASDSFGREVADAKGRLVEVTYRKLQSGNQDADVTLKREGNAYAYSGTWEQKPISGTIAEKVIEGDLVHWQKVKALLAGKQKEVSLPSYSPSTDPTAATKVTYRKLQTGPGAVEMEMGPLKLAGEADENGVMKRSALTMGRITVVTERIYVKGAP